MAINNSFRQSDEIMKVQDLTEKYHQTFDKLIVTFQSKVLPGLLKQKLIEMIPDRSYGSSHSNYPIYQVVGQPKTLFYLMPIGAPITVGTLEEIVYSMGISKIVMYGSAGVLNHDIAEKKIIIPTKAYRDEGTSYHYMPSSDFVDINNHDIVCKLLEDLGIEFVKGYTWTTDGFYRETKEIYQERISQGCLCVEMEISAVQAFANLRGVNLYTFVYSTDSLDHSGWNKRVLGKLSVDERVDYFFVAKYISSRI